MHRLIRRQPWTCARCLRQQQKQVQRRALVGVASAAHQDALDLPVPSHETDQVAHDDRTMRRIFDSREFWQEFKQGKRIAGEAQATGLLQNKYLNSPQGFQRFTQDALQKCQRIVRTILDASQAEDFKKVVRHLDRLSDQLCRVIDLVDFIRNVHPSQDIQHAAAVAHAQMFEYMNVLNTTKGLEDQLNKAMGIPGVASNWSEEEKVTAKILLKDFAQSAIDGPEDVKNRFIELTSRIAQKGQEMIDYMAPAKATLKFSSSRLRGMNPTVVKKLTRFGTSSIPILSREATHALSTVEDPDVRKEIYIANRQASNSSIGRVEDLVEARAELAKLADYSSFGHMTLSDKMAQSPEAVSKFLNALTGDNKEHMSADMAELTKLKVQSFPNSAPHIEAWDTAFYTTKLRQRQQAAIAARPMDLLASHFSLGTVFQGLSRLFERLYGVRLSPRTPSPGETWNSDVRRLDVVDENEGHIAVIYCDLFSRPNKSPNPAHFTLRCSREISSDEINEAMSNGSLPVASSPSHLPLSELSTALNDGMALSISPTTGAISQLPTIAFICDFNPPSSSTSTPTLLTLRQVLTLYHEMGHCLHSILGRTKLQNVAGTRCATDFAELPSILMEHFAVCPDVLALYARHWETDKPLDVDLVEKEIDSQRRYISAGETEGQILLSVLDQRLHGPDAMQKMAGGQRGWSTDVYQGVWNDHKFSSVQEPPGTSWHGFFGHLFQYGAVYYSYLFDRAIAGKIWNEVFSTSSRYAGVQSLLGNNSRAPSSRSALAREQGQRYRDEVLKWGGGRDGWACVAGVLGPEKAWMREGGEKAMEEVGRWGAKEDGVGGGMM